MKKTLVGFFVVFTALTISGCAKKDPLAGTWNASIPAEAAGTLSDFTYTFDAPNFTSSAKFFGIQMNVKGTYTLTKDQLSLNPTEITVDETNLPAEIKPQWPQVKTEIESESKKPSVYTLTITGDTAILKSANSTLTLTRKK